MFNISTTSSTMNIETKPESTTNGISPAIAFNESSAENEIKPIIGLTTHKPILVTWCNIQVSNTETPTTPTDWILIPSVMPVETSTFSTQLHDKNATFILKPLTTKNPLISVTSKPEHATKSPLTTYETTTKESYRNFYQKHYHLIG